MRIGDQGPEVQELQIALLSRGYRLPRYGADGDFGRETRAALVRFAVDHGVGWGNDEDVPEELLEALGVDEPDVPACDGDIDLEGVKLYDLRHEQVDPHPKGKTGPDGRTVRRSSKAIDSIVLHQTAVRFARPRGTTDDLALARRSLRVACHAMAFYQGFVAWPADLHAYIHHANRANGRSLGLEVDGNYPGLIGGKVRTGTETPLTDAVVHAARMGVKLLVEEGRRVGMPIRRIYAHRQFDSWRRADPGEGLWRRVVLEYAVPELGLIPYQAESFGHPKGFLRHGKRIPKRWDPDGVGSY